MHKLFVLDFRRDLDGDPEADSSEGGREPESGFAHGRREKSRCCDLKYDKKKIWIKQVIAEVRPRRKEKFAFFESASEGVLGESVQGSKRVIRKI